MAVGYQYRSCCGQWERNARGHTIGGGGEWENGAALASIQNTHARMYTHTHQQTDTPHIKSFPVEGYGIFNVALLSLDVG